MRGFTKWLIVSILLACIGLIAVFNVEEWARVAGELQRTVLLIVTLSTFLLAIVSLACLVKANAGLSRRKMLISLFTSLLPITVFIMSGLIFTVYFIGK